MAGAGALACLGLATNALHLVVGAMIVAPGFEPIAHAALCLVAGSGRWRGSLLDTLGGYGALALGAAVTALALRGLGTPVVPGDASYFARGVLVSYWTTLTAPGVLVSAVAAVIGALLISIQRPTLTLGVMIALALVPSSALVGIAVVHAEPRMLGESLGRWLLDVGLVAAGSLAVFRWKHERVDRRSMAM